VDLELSWGPGGGDLILESGDLSDSGGVVTAVLLSLFSDAKVPADDSRPLLDQDLRGYWAEVAGDSYGSSLWLLDRAKATAASAALAADSATSALQWLKTEGIAASASASASYLSDGTLQLAVSLTRGTSKKWASLWTDAEALLLRSEGLLLQVSPG
jgi:phage gp46-like protein